ncbi:metallophosphoesterase family protein [Methylobacterium gnaphalii]|uniref:Metallophosphoesterase n=1 Tax=Methylobacterium gnaphalii TaxID=1010610 RepID=A0A512JLH1_9HYPH|nr:metallophosphoesterase [Methylobacterium gnaphalii]GEP10763.1 metallophosphoesterase [Methylobacterium gnaphalii]GJD67366.1 3',5'-cyclic adenosine monophosphate phosphodiesterase CpdA [Methylobacterium gnaphalii]GLS49302.1 metallophosphoesterase [Methylobacterium gnaphalii]
MRRIAHISDLHFGCTNPDVVEGLITELNADRPDLIVISGDFTMRSRQVEYRQAQAFLNRLTSRWIGVPGNHDIACFPLPGRFIRPFQRYCCFIAEETEPTFLDEEIGVVCLNTVRTWAPDPDWSQGRIGREQILRAGARLAALPPHVFRIVVGHHPFAPPPWNEKARLVGRAGAALDAFRRHHVGLTLAGHFHRHYSRFVTVDGVQRDAACAIGGQQLLVVQAGSATSTRLRGREPNAYNRIVVENGAATVTVRLWNGADWQDAPCSTGVSKLFVDPSGTRNAGLATERAAT